MPITRVAYDPMSTDPTWLPAVEEGIPRDRKDRPMIVPAEGAEVIAYERISRVAEAADTLRWLMNYYVGMTAKGMSPDLYAMAAGIEWNDPKMAEIVATAQDRGGANAKANYGTAIHQFQHHGLAYDAIPDEFEFDMRALRLGLERARLEPVASEVFVVNDDLRVAGTFDSILRHMVEDADDNLGDVVGDWKTGRKSLLSWAVQIGIYSRCYAVDPLLIAAGRYAERHPLGVNQRIGVVGHIPRGGGCAEFVPINIEDGFALAEQAIFMKSMQDRADGEWIIPEGLSNNKIKRGEVIDGTIEGVTCREELQNIARNVERWLTSKQRAAMNRRWYEVGWRDGRAAR